MLLLWKGNEHGLPCRIQWHPSMKFTVIYVGPLHADHAWFRKNNVTIMRDELKRLCTQNPIICIDHHDVDAMYDFMVQTIFARVFGFLVSFSDTVTGVVGADTARLNLITEANNADSEFGQFYDVSQQIMRDIIDMIMGSYVPEKENARTDILSREYQSVSHFWEKLTTGTASADECIPVLMDVDSFSVPMV